MTDGTRTRVLLALLMVYEKRGRVTHTDLVQVTGLSRSTINGYLHELRAEGFVDWNDGQHGTLRPLVERVA